MNVERGWLNNREQNAGIPRLDSTDYYFIIVERSKESFSTSMHGKEKKDIDIHVSTMTRPNL